MDKELIKKAKATNSPAELKDFANKLGISLNDDEAKHYFDVMHSDAKLSAQELATVSGGGCKKERMKIKDIFEHICSDWKWNPNISHGITDPDKLSSCAFCTHRNGTYCDK